MWGERGRQNGMENQKSLQAQLRGKEGRGEIWIMSSGSGKARQWFRAGVHSGSERGEVGAVEEKEGGGGKVGAWLKSCDQWLDEKRTETRRASARLRTREGKGKLWPELRKH